MTGVIWSISTTALQAGIKLQLNTMLFTKTLVKKDIASASDDAGNVGGVAEEAAKDRKKGSDKTEKAQDGEDEGVSSKTQIMARVSSEGDAWSHSRADAVHCRRRSRDRICIPR